MSVKPLVSVIIPVYNVEKYLHRCVDSVIGQTHCNIEIILVDDGSPDNCPAICDEYAKKDDRITVIHKKNGGLSDARNVGIDASHGEWLSFIDSDDWIEPDMYEALLINADKYDAQISVGGVRDEIESHGKTTVTKTTFDGSEKTDVLTACEAMNRYFYGSWAAWDKLYRREIFHEIRYPKGEINEDEAIVLQVLNKCEHIVYTNRVFYHYISRENSITSSAFSLKKLAWYKHCKANYEWICKNYPDIKTGAAKKYCDSILWSLTALAKSSDYSKKEAKPIKEDLKANFTSFKKTCSDNTKKLVSLYLIRYLPFRVYRKCVRS